MSKHKKKSKSASYDHMQGSPMDVVDHPVRNIPDPTGGMFNPTSMPMGTPEGQSVY